MADEVISPGDNDEDTITVALMNAPFQIIAAFDNLQTVIDMIPVGDPRRDSVRNILMDAQGRVDLLTQAI